MRKEVQAKAKTEAENRVILALAGKDAREQTISMFEKNYNGIRRY